MSEYLPSLYADTRSSYKSDERVDTPSTDCGEEMDLAHWSQESPVCPQETISDAPGLVRNISPIVSKRSRGLSRQQFVAAVRQPFKFPAIPVASKDQEMAPIPICIICQHQINAGDSCRELASCGHCFHAHCVEVHFSQHTRCPVCRARCRAVTTGRRSSGSTRSIEKSKPRPCWSPQYDAELMSISDRVDRERRARIYIRSSREDTPQSQVFLKTSLPILLEECYEEMHKNDGSLSSLCKYLDQEKEKRLLRNVESWNKDMRKLAIAWTLTLINMYIYQHKFVELYLKQLFPKH